jgi:Phage tail protein
MSWEFGGTNLDTAGDWQTTVIEGVGDLPDVRGDNIVIPFANGSTHVRKFFDERIVTIGIAVQGSSLSDTQSNLDTLLAKFANRTRQLLKHTMPDASIRQAYAEVRSRVNTAWKGPKLALMTVEFTLADPFMRSDTKSSTTKTINANPTAWTLNNPGTAEERLAIITLTGPLSHPAITNSTNGAVLQYDDVLAANTDIVTIDCGLFTAVDETAAIVLDKIIHTNSPSFFVLDPGNNVLSIADGTHTTGTVKIEFYPPYL